MSKIKTNEQMFKAFFKDINQFEMALLRERMALMMEITRETIVESPEKWPNGFIDPKFYIQLADKFEKHLGFNK
jgi:hypothetical protein